MQKNLQTLRAQTLSDLQQITPHPLPNRPVSTNQLAEMLNIKPDTIRRSLCLKGHHSGLTPIKMTNGRLMWRLQ